MIIILWPVDEEERVVVVVSVVVCHFCGEEIEVDEASVVTVRHDQEWVCGSCEEKWDEYQEVEYLTPWVRDRMRRLYVEEK